MVKQIEEIVPCILVSNDEYWVQYSLKCIRGHFGRYVIYDIGSKDKTRDILRAFVDKEKANSDIYYRELPMLSKQVQGIFRNSMVAEARSDWYFILDGDELYTKRGIQDIKDSYLELQREHEFYGKIYGVIRRVEVCDDLKSAYGIKTYLPHHRVYHRTAIWTGPHPGERALYNQTSNTEHTLEVPIICYHFHNTLRSSTENIALERKNRKDQATYRRGIKSPFNLFKTLPILQKPTDTKFPVNPVLSEYQKVWNSG